MAKGQQTISSMFFRSSASTNKAAKAPAIADAAKVEETTVDPVVQIKKVTQFKQMKEWTKDHNVVPSPDKADAVNDDEVVVVSDQDDEAAAK